MCLTDSFLVLNIRPEMALIYCDIGTYVASNLYWFGKNNDTETVIFAAIPAV